AQPLNCSSGGLPASNHTTTMAHLVRLISNPRYEIFLNELKRTKRRFSKWNDIAFRAAPLEFARIVNLLDGKGSFKFGGRWSAAGTFPAVIRPTKQEPALAEGGVIFPNYDWP